MNRPINFSDKPSSFLTTAQVSQALGVSVTTVKRWVDDAILPAYRTPGGHRKLLMADILRAVRAGQLPATDLSRLIATPAATPDRFLRQFIDAANQLDTATIGLVIRSAHDAGIAVPILADQIVSPGLAYVGKQWVEGRLDIMHEHCINQACLAALYEIQNTLTLQAGQNRPVAVGGAPEGDYSILPSLMARMTLLELGWNAINLGPHSPFSALAAALDDFSPKLVWLTISHVLDEERFVKEYAEFYEKLKQRGAALAIGGSGLTETLRRRLPYTTHGDGLSHLAAFANTLHRRPARPKRGRPFKNRES